MQKRSWSDVTAQPLSLAHPLQWGRRRIRSEMHRDRKTGTVGLRKFFMKGKKERETRRMKETATGDLGNEPEGSG